MPQKANHVSTEESDVSEAKVETHKTDDVPSQKRKGKSRKKQRHRTEAASLDTQETGNGASTDTSCDETLDVARRKMKDKSRKKQVPKTGAASVYNQMKDVIPGGSEELYDSLDSGEDYIPKSADASEDSLSGVSSVSFTRLSPRQKVHKDVASAVKDTVPDSTTVDRNDGDSSDAECGRTEDEDCAGTSQKPVLRKALGLERSQCCLTDLMD